MSIDNHVAVTITQNNVTIDRASFGIGLLLSHNASFSGLTKEYTDADEVLDDYSTDEPEYLCAQKYFAQDPRPEKLKIGKSPSSPTLRYTLNVVNVKNSHEYQLLVKGTGVTETTVSYTSDGTALDSEIVAGLVSALNGVTGANFTAAGASSPFTITADAPGNWFSIEVLDRDDLSTEVDHADPGLATDLAAIKVADNEWYQLITMYNSSAYVLAAAAWIETQKKRYSADCYDTTAVTATVGSGTDVLDDLFTQQYQRTMGVWHSDPSAFLAGGWAGRVLAADAGTVDEKWHQLNSMTAVSLTSTERTNLRNKRGNSYENAGVNITFDGDSSKTGTYFDNIRDRDALEDDVQKTIMEGFVRRDKTEQSDEGIAEVEADLREALRKNTRSPGSGPKILQSFSVTVPKYADISTADKSNRLLPDVKFSGVLGSGWRKVNIKGTVSL